MISFSEHHKLSVLYLFCLFRFIYFYSSYKEVWPLSLLALRGAARALSLTRTPVGDVVEAFTSANCVNVRGIRCCVGEKLHKYKENSFMPGVDSSDKESSGSSERLCGRDKCNDFNSRTSNINKSDGNSKNGMGDKDSTVNGVKTCSNMKVNVDHLKAICHPKLSYVFDKHVKPKKRHEISRMAKVSDSNLGFKYETVLNY